MRIDDKGIIHPDLPKLESSKITAKEAEDALTDEQIMMIAVGQEYKETLLAIKEAVGCTYDQAAIVAARMARQGFVWERINNETEELKS